MHVPEKRVRTWSLFQPKAEGDQVHLVMTRAIDVLHMQWNAVRRHPWTVLGILLCVAGVLELAIRHEEQPKALAYLGAMLVCAFIIDLFAQWFPMK